MEQTYLGLPPPFSSTVGNEQLKTALLLTLIDPRIGGVLAIGPKGTGKSRTVRSFRHLLPKIPVVDLNCPFSCPVDLALACEICGEHIRSSQLVKTKYKPMEFVFLPISTTEDSLIGSLDISAAIMNGKVDSRPGIFARANRNLLVIEEVNLLPDPLIDTIMSVIDEKKNRIEREGISSQHPVSTVILGTMNREEGDLRPHFAERFGLSAFTRPSDDLQDRLEIIRENVPALDREYALQDMFVADQQLKETIHAARERIGTIRHKARDLKFVSLICEELELDGARVAEILYRTARSMCALRGASELTSTDFFVATQLASGHRTRKGGELPAPTVDELRDAFDRAIERDRLQTTENEANEFERHLSQIHQKEKLYQRKRLLGKFRICLVWIILCYFVLLVGFKTIFQGLILITPFILIALALASGFKRSVLDRRKHDESSSTKMWKKYYREPPWPLGMDHPLVGIIGMILLPASIHLLIIMLTHDLWTPLGLIPYLVIYIAILIGFRKRKGGRIPLHEIPTKYEREYEFLAEDLLNAPAPEGLVTHVKKDEAVSEIPKIDRDFLLAMKSESKLSPEWEKILTTLISYIPESFRSGTSLGTDYRESIYRQQVPLLKKSIHGQISTGAGGKRAQAITNLSKGRVIGWKTPGGRPKNIHLASTIRKAALRQARMMGLREIVKKSKEPFVRVTRADILEKRFLWKSRATVIFVLDLSRSMERVLTAVQEAILFLHQDAYRKRDRVGLVACRGTEAAIVQYPTTNINLVAKQIDSLAVGGLTPLPSGVLLAQKTLENELRRDRECIPIMIVVSDGGTNVPLPWHFRENRPRFLKKTYELWTGDGVKDAVKDLFLVAEKVRRAGISTISIVPFTPYDPSSSHGFSTMKGFQELTRGQMFMPSMEGLHLVPTIGEAVSRAIHMEKASF